MLENQMIQLLPAGQVFPLEWRDRSLRHEAVNFAIPSRVQKNSEGKFLQIDFPIAAQFEILSQFEQIAKHRMAMPSFFNRILLRLGIGVQNIVPLDLPLMCGGQPPEIYQIRAQ